MAIHADTLLDRLRLKQQVNRWRVAALLAMLVALLVLGGRFTSLSHGLGMGSIARVTISGFIEDDLNMQEMLQEIAENDRIKAVIVRIDSPGGSAVGGEQIYKDLRSISEHKPVVVTMRNIAASAGYLVALGGDYILAEPGTLTGSIGVIMQSAEVTELAEKLGIRPITVKSAPLKAAPSPFEEYTERDEAMLENVIDSFFRHFLALVQSRRQLNEAQLLVVADGRILTGEQAIAAGLVDRLGGEQDALEWLESEKQITDLDVIDVKPDRDDLPLFLQTVQGMASNLTLPGWISGRQGLLAVWSNGPL